MKRLLFVVTLAAAAAAQSANFQYARMGGLWYASSFAEWTARTGTEVNTPGLATLSVPARITLPGGGEMQPVTASVPVLVEDGSHSETITPTSVTCDAQLCEVTATFRYSHASGVRLTSASGGLDEALLAARDGGGTVIVDNAATAAQINNVSTAAGSSSAAVVDRHGLNSLTYLWNGTAYVSGSPLVATTLTASGPAITSTGIEGTLFADQFPGATAGGQLDAAVASLHGKPGIVVAPPGMGYAQPTGLGSNQILIQEQGTAPTNPSGLQFLQGQLPGGNAITDNTLMNLSQFSQDPGSVPQNTLYVQHITAGNESGNGQNANWSIFAAGQVRSPTSAPDFMEEDGIEAEASALGTGAPPHFRLVSSGAQSWVENNPTDSITIPYAIDFYARAPFIAGTGGTASVQNAVGLLAEQPIIGTSSNYAVAISSFRPQDPAQMVFQHTGNTVWQELLNNFTGSQTDDLFLVGAGSPSQSATLYMGHGGDFGGSAEPAPAYLNSAGSASVNINNMPTPTNFAPFGLGTGGLAVGEGGSTGSLKPVATQGDIRLVSGGGLWARNASNTGDIDLMDTDGSDNIRLGRQGAASVEIAAPLTVGGGSPVQSISLASSTIAFPTVAAQSCNDQSLAVAGAILGHGVAQASPSAALGSGNLSWSAWVSNTGVVSVRVCNPSNAAITPATVLWNLEVIQ